MSWIRLNASSDPVNTLTTTETEMSWDFVAASTDISDTGSLISPGGTRLVVPSSMNGETVQLTACFAWDSANYSTDHYIQIFYVPSGGSATRIERSLDRYQGRAAESFRTRPISVSTGDEFYITTYRTIGTNKNWDSGLTGMGLSTMGRMGVMRLTHASGWTAPSGTWAQTPNGWNVAFDSASAYNATTERIEPPSGATAAICRINSANSNRDNDIGASRMIIFDSDDNILRYENFSWVGFGDNRWQSTKTSCVFSLDGVASFVPEYYATGSSSERFLRGGGSTSIEVEWIA